VQRLNPAAENVATASQYRDLVARTGRFLTFAGGGATIGYRLREDPEARASIRLIRETAAGIVVSGKIGMHTSLPFAEDVYVGTAGAVTCGAHRLTYVVPVAAPGVTVVCRKMAARHQNPFMAPLSSRFDELDAQMWLDNVLIPWDRVFCTEPPPGTTGPPPFAPRRGQSVTSWLFWHQLYCWLAKAECTLGLALACTDAMALREDPQTIEYLVDLVVDVQTVSSCLTAAERDPEMTQAGYCFPGLTHIAVGSMAMLKARQRMTEILRILPGSSLVVTPADTDLVAPEMAAGLEESFGGGGYTALQRAALLQMAWDHSASDLDSRESAFELHANGGMPVWRDRLRTWFDRYNELANGVMGLLDVAMPRLDFTSLRLIPQGQRRQARVPPPR
jgi:4-hydroxyphenylacetate 3-monooxygenase